MAAIVAAQSDGGDVEVWPENWQTFQLFARLRTQWSAGMGGITGLRYEAIYPLIDRLAGGDPAEWDCIFDDIQAMEAAAIEARAEGHAE